MLNVCPADLLHETKLHAHGLHGVAPTLPWVPLHSSCTINAHSSPAINTIRVYMVTVVVPKCPQVCLGTATGRPILIFVKGGELHSIVVSQTIPCRNTTKTESFLNKLASHRHRVQHGKTRNNRRTGAIYTQSQETDETRIFENNEGISEDWDKK